MELHSLHAQEVTISNHTESVISYWLYINQETNELPKKDGNIYDNDLFHKIHNWPTRHSTGKD